MVSGDISDVVITSERSEKNFLKKLIKMMKMMVINKLQETIVFSGRQKLTSTMKLRPEK